MPHSPRLAATAGGTVAAAFGSIVSVTETHSATIVAAAPYRKGFTDMETLTAEAITAETLTASPTIADVIAAMVTADASLAALADAVLADHSAFTASALTTAAAIAAGVTAKSIATAAKAAGVGYTSPSAVLRHSRTGEVLAIGGTVDTDVFGPRDIQLCYDKSTKLNGARVTVSVTPKQHAAIVANATDVNDAYRLLVKANRENLAALRATAEANAAETDETETDETDETETAPATIAELLATALAALADIAAMGTVAMTSADVAVMDECQTMLTAIADNIGEIAD